MARSAIEKAKGRRESGRFAMVPDNVLKCPELHSVPGEAVRLLLALTSQYNGRNNGDLCAALSVLRDYGFTSADTVSRGLKVLLDAGLILRTRDGTFQGGASTCALFAIAWKAIDACPGKGLTVRPTSAPPRVFRAAAKATHPVRKSDISQSENRSGQEKEAVIPIRKSER